MYTLWIHIYVVKSTFLEMPAYIACRKAYNVMIRSLFRTLVMSCEFNWGQAVLVFYFFYKKLHEVGGLNQNFIPSYSGV